MTNAGVSICNLSMSYGRKTVLDHINLDLFPGAIYGLLGANGSGKSTLLRIITGALRPSEGKIKVAGKTGYVAQKFSLYDDLLVEENIEFYGRCHGLAREQLAGRVTNVLALLELDSNRRMRTGHLSHGWKQRVAFASALCHQPSILLLDEPTAGIDPIARPGLWEIFNECRRGGATIILTTHDLDEANRCDRVGYLQGGRLVVSSTPAELKAAGQSHCGRPDVSLADALALAVSMEQIA